jgi:glycosyltransferase involved in cell wall biosynthesis
MKVLVCIPCLLNGGTEVQTLSLVEALVAAGHNVAVACYFEYTPAMVEQYRHAGAEVLLLSPEGNRPLGIKDMLYSLWRGLRYAVHSFKPDVAHVQYMHPGLLAVLILRVLGIKKIIATTHTGGDIYSSRGLKMIKWLSNHVLIAFQCITLRAEKSYFGTASLFDGTLKSHFTIYNALPSHIRITEHNRPVIADEATLTVGVVSRLAHIKGMDLVVPAFAKVYAGNSHLKLLVVGDGPEREGMEMQTKRLGLEQHVTFVGVKQPAELTDYYDQIDILLMPSRSEGFGLTAIEGMARGCVPVVADTGGLPEVVTPESGLLHRYEDIDDIADKILSLANNRSRLSKFSEGAIHRAKTFSQENYRSAIAKLYTLIH